MNEPRWLTINEIVVAQERQLAQFGGAAGIRDQGALEFAATRAKNKWHYEAAGIADLAAAYGYGLAKSHPFVDGNKRAAFVSMLAFLRLNGVRFAPPQDQSTAIMFGVAAGDISEASLTRWIADNLPND